MADPARISPALTLLILAGAALASTAVFLTIGAEGRWSFVLALRGQKLASLVLVGYAIAISTVLFQTVLANRILTPSIMGFDAVYVLIQTLCATFVGYARMNLIGPRLQFAIGVVVMGVVSVALARRMFAGGRRDLYFLALAGLVLGGIMRGIASFLQRILDPAAFAVLQDRMFASFNGVDGGMILSAVLPVIAVSWVAWRMRETFDVLALGREPSISLGVDYTRTVTLALMIIAVLVSVSTALVGPVTFFGLLVSNLAYRLMNTHRHAFILPAAALVAVICLVMGQVIVEQLFGFSTSLSIVIEFFGGIVFIVLLLRGRPS